MSDNNLEKSQQETGLSECSLDIFDEKIESNSKSKTINILNIIYAMVIGLLTNFICQNHSKKARKIGLAMSIGSYLLIRKLTNECKK